MAKLGDSVGAVVDESMPLMREKLTDFSALKSHGCFTVAQCALVPRALIRRSDAPFDDDCDDEFSYLHLMQIDIRQGRLDPKHPSTLIPYSQYVRLMQAGTYDDPNEMPIHTVAWLISVDDATNWFKSHGIEYDFGILRDVLMRDVLAADEVSRADEINPARDADTDPVNLPSIRTAQPPADDQISLWMAACMLSGQHFSGSSPSPATIEHAQVLCKAVIGGTLPAYRTGLRLQMPPPGVRHITGPIVLIRLIAEHADGISDWESFRASLAAIFVVRSEFAGLSSKLSPSKDQYLVEVDGEVSVPMATPEKDGGAMRVQFIKNSVQQPSPAWGEAPIDDISLKDKVRDLANQVAAEIRLDGEYASLNQVCKALCRDVTRKKNKEILWGQKGWRGMSWLKSAGGLKGWSDPAIEK